MNKLIQRMAILEKRLVPKQAIDHSAWVLPDDDKRDIEIINGRHWRYVEC